MELLIARFTEERYLLGTKMSMEAGLSAGSAQMYCLRLKIKCRQNAE